MSATQHLVGVWNPSYSRSAMDEHLAVLLSWARRLDDDTATDDDVYVWWGKVRSSNRQKPQEHAAEIVQVAKFGESNEVHLYLTDYRSLYVGEVIGVVSGDIPSTDREHAPGYYFTGDFHCDFCFKLGDIRRLVVDDTPLVIEELKKLRNVRYNDRPVSLYGGMVDLPLVVRRPDGMSFFDTDQRDYLIDNRLWAEFDADAGSAIGGIERDLRDKPIWTPALECLDSSTRSFIAGAEHLYRQHRNDGAI